MSVVSIAKRELKINKYSVKIYKISIKSTHFSFLKKHGIYRMFQKRRRKLQKVTEQPGCDPFIPSIDFNRSRDIFSFIDSWMDGWSIDRTLPPPKIKVFILAV